VPVFRLRNEIQPAAVARSAAWLPWVSAGILALVCGILLFQNATLRRRAGLGMGPTPHLARFWRQMFGAGGPTYLVLSDANLVVFEDAIRRHLTIQEYQNRLFESVANEAIQDQEKRTLMLNLVGRVYTGFSDAIAARRIGLVCAASELPLDVVIARETTAAQVSSHNTILLGSRRANPWVNLYEDKLNFRTGFAEAPRAAYFSSTDAGSDFITSEKRIRALREGLGLRDSDPFPYFEVLLRGPVVNNSVPQFQVVAVRRH
jgi:hypothetical protein